jgi:predicted amidohydrolase
VYNSAALFDAAGRPLLNHRKLHLWGEAERSVFAAGDRLAVARLDGLRVGLLICYDLEFPEAARALALEGADLILTPTALPAGTDPIPRIVVPARAWENQLYVAYANRCGQEAGLTYLGQSTVAAPDAAILGRAGEGEEMLVADLDRDRLQASRAENPYLADRRPGVYRP